MNTRATVKRLSALPVLFALFFNILLVAPVAPIGADDALALAGSTFDATDGNLVVDGAETDWCTSPGTVVVKNDLPTGQTDDSYAEGAKEDDLNPPVEFGSIPNNKVDLTRVYVTSETGAGGDLFVYVGWIRSDDNGTGTISFELNQSDVVLSNGANHQRTVGDLLITFDFGGGDFESLEVNAWTGTAWGPEVDLVGTGLGEGSVNQADVADCISGGTIDDLKFGEFSFNLTDLIGGDCRSFAGLFAKSRASNPIESKLKELVGPAGVNFSTCGQITINKVDGNQQPLGGATFSVTPNPFTLTGSLSVTDNSAPDDNPAAGAIHLSDVEPGQYTVCETDAPDGYIGDPTCQQLTVGVNGAATFTFVNTLGAISWTKVDDETGLALCCAAFSLDGIAGPADAFGPITIVDNGQNDEDPDSGELLVSGLLLGTYRITETAAPAGYGLPTPTFQDVVLGGASASPANAFRDPPHPALSVVKTPDGAQATSGDVATFTVVTTNNGPGTALGVSLTDTLPAVENGWQVESENWAGACTITGSAGAAQSLSCGPENLANGASRSVTVTTTVTDEDCGPLPNSATADGTNTDPASDGGDITVLCPVIRVEKTPDRSEQDPSANDISAGENATFTITVHNDGDGEARDVTLFDDLPETANGWSLVPADTTLSNCAVSNDPALGEVLDCGPDGIPAGGSLKVTVTTETTEDDCGPLDNTASAEAENNGSDSDGASIDLLCPDLVIEKTPDGEVISAGEEISYTITVTNNGPGTAFDVEIDDELPAGFAWAEDPDLTECEITAGDLHCDVVDLASSASFSVTVSAPTDEHDCSETAYENTAVADAANHAEISDTGTVLIECPDIDVTKTPDGEVINAGDEISFTITVTNNGPGTAFDIVLDDELPAGFAWAEDPDLTECEITAGDLYCDIGDLGHGDTFSVTVSAPTDEHDCADEAYVNTAVADASNHAQVSDTGDVLIECPDIVVDKTPDGEAIDAGDDVNFTITVTNNGPGTASAVVLDDELPAGFAWAEDPDLTECEITGGDLHCDIGDMAANDSFSVTVSAPTSAEDCAENAYVNTAVADADNHAAVNDTGDVRVDCPDVTVDKEAVASPISAGEEGQFTIEVTNLGPGTAHDVVMTDFAPDGTVWTVLDDGGADCSSQVGGSQQSITCEIGMLADGGTVTILIGYTTSQEDCGSLDNSAAVEASNEPQANLENNEDDASIVVECPGLNILKFADADPIDAGETASFTITVWNKGPGDASDVIVTDDLPAGLTWDIQLQDPDADDTCASSLADGQQSFSCEFGTLGVTEMAGGKVIVVSAETTREDCGVLDNTAFADASNGDEVSSNATITVKCPTIALDKENDALGSVLPGTEVTYTLTLTVDDGPAEDVEVVDAPPAGLEDPTDISDGGVFDDAAGTITWSLGDLANGDYVLTYQAVVSDDVENGEELVNVAAATSPNSQCPDLETLGPECEDDSTVIVRVPTLVVDKAADTELITISGPNDAPVATPSVVTWTLTYTLADGPVTNAVITDEIPDGLVFLDASDGGTFANGEVTWTFPTLTASGSVTFRTTVDPETISRVGPTVNVAVIDSDHTEPDEGEDGVTVTVEPPPLGGNPTPAPRPALPNTAVATGTGGEPVTVPLELLGVVFLGSLGALAFANVRARGRRR